MYWYKWKQCTDSFVCHLSIVVTDQSPKFSFNAPLASDSPLSSAKVNLTIVRNFPNCQFEYIFTRPLRSGEYCLYSFYIPVKRKGWGPFKCCNIFSYYELSHESFQGTHTSDVICIPSKHLKIHKRKWFTFRSFDLCTLAWVSIGNHTGWSREKFTS